MVNDLPVALTMLGLSFFLAVIWGDPFIAVLKRMGLGKQILESLPGSHQVKAGTPTFGGILIIVPVVLLTLALNLVSLLNPEIRTGRSILLPLGILIGYGLLGMIDDWEGVHGAHSRGEGISARAKIVAQIALALGAALIMSLWDGGVQHANTIYLPFIGIPLNISPLLWIPLATFIIVAASNAVNFTDGLDGLAGIITATAFGTYGLIAYLQGQIFLTQFCFLIVGGCFAFLWYNAFPAQLFMGDTGSLALGAALGTVALMTGQYVLLVVIAFVPVAETLSVIAQILSLRYTGRRLLKMAPLHLHYQQSGWSEVQVVQRFWIVALVGSMLGIALALV
ncbi:MAG: phospho-N-acetylmuramoyl-pentapeptide-transferase [Anaerolineae bacterium]|nr:phospho-N-acetylmuramoyl-pentapeptide-transferase [Anaerolineae bacterium]